MWCRSQITVAGISEIGRRPRENSSLSSSNEAPAVQERRNAVIEDKMQFGTTGTRNTKKPSQKWGYYKKHYTEMRLITDTEYVKNPQLLIHNCYTEKIVSYEFVTKWAYFKKLLLTSYLEFLYFQNGQWERQKLRGILFPSFAKIRSHFSKTNCGKVITSRIYGTYRGRSNEPFSAPTTALNLIKK